MAEVAAIPNDMCRCHDSGCMQHETCFRWLDRNNSDPQVRHCASLFPYDIPLCDPCPLYMEAVK